MKKIAKIIAVILTAVTMLMLSSCSSGKVVYERPDNKGSVTGRSWTVLVYMCGGEEEAQSGKYSERLRELMDVEYPANINVAVQTGGSSNWSLKGIYSEYIQRFEANKGSLYLADRQMTANMGDYKTLVDFLQWGTSNYKSDKYMLIIAGEGGGSIYGAGYDELNENDSLTLDEISRAMSKTGVNFDIVGFDSSLMGSLETASSLSTYANYLVASQEFEAPCGWDYKGMLEYLSVNPSADTSEIGKAICDTYYAKCKKNKYDADATMSVVDMSKVSALSQSFDGLAGEMVTDTDSMGDYITLDTALNKTHIYGGATEDEGFSNMVDLGDMAVKVMDCVGNTSNALLSSLNDAVIYRVCGERQKNCMGMSVYYPINEDSEELNAYMEISPSGKYKEFLRRICASSSVEDSSGSTDYTSSWAWTTYDNDIQWMDYKTLIEDNTYELNVVGNMSLFSDVAINVYRADSSGKYVFLGKYRRLDANESAGIYKDNFNGKMIKLFGKAVTARLVREYDDYDIYSVPVFMKGEMCFVRVRYDRYEGKYDIIGVWDGINKQNKKSGTGMRKIGFFDSIRPALAVYDTNASIEEYDVNNAYIQGGSAMKLFGGVKEGKVPNGSYMLSYELTDIYGNAHIGTAAKGRVSGGKIQY